MRLLSLILQSLFAMCAVAAPTDFELHSPLAIPVPGSSTYDADLAAAVAYARSHSSSSSAAVKTSATAPRRRLCGSYDPGNKNVWSSGYSVCEDTENGEMMERFTNRMCGICMVFDKSQCQGTIVGFWGKGTPPQEPPIDKSHWAHGGRSYFCY